MLRTFQMTLVYSFNVKNVVDPDQMASSDPDLQCFQIRIISDSAEQELKAKGIQVFSL